MMILRFDVEPESMNTLLDPCSQLCGNFAETA
jgi:hypothetical protein